MSDRKFGIRVKVWNPAEKDYSWFWLSPVGKPRYEFDSSEDAHLMKVRCYPGAGLDWARVEEIFND